MKPPCFIVPLRKAATGLRAARLRTHDLPEDDGGGDGDGGHEGVGAAIVAGMDAAPVLELAEHLLDPVALAIEGAVVRDRYLAVGFLEDALRDATRDQVVSEPVGVVVPVAEHGVGSWQRVDHQRGALVIAHLALR